MRRCLRLKSEDDFRIFGVLALTTESLTPERTRTMWSIYADIGVKINFRRVSWRKPVELILGEGRG